MHPASALVTRGVKAPRREVPARGLPYLDQIGRAHPDAYQFGASVAERLLADSRDRERAQFCLDLVESHLRLWPVRPEKNGLTEMQYAQSLGFRDALRKHLRRM